MASAEKIQGSLETYVDFDSPMGTNIYEAVGSKNNRSGRLVSQPL